MSSSSTNNLFPIFLKLEELNLLIVGGGLIGLEKLNAILDNSPKTKIKLVAKEINDDIKKLATEYSNLQLIEKGYEKTDLKGIDIAIAAVSDIQLSQIVKTDAKEAGILLNAADKPSICDFYLGSIVQKGDLKIAISTNGKSPTMAKRVKETLNEVFPNETQEVLENLYKIRESLKGNFEYKVKTLNNLTKNYELPSEAKNETNKIVKTALYSVAIIFLMILGHLFFSFVPIKDIGNAILSNLDANIILYIAGGFIAQMIDGALGMAYGITATTFLLSFGISPAASSASVHASEVFTSGASGLMHLKFGNVNTKLFKSLLIPGVIGAILGAYILSSFEQYNFIIKPLVSTYTLILGAIIIFKALKNEAVKQKIKKIFPLALVGGFLDSIGGGGWGPIVSSTLIARGRNPRYTIGSVNLAEFFIALSSSLTFVTIIGLTHWIIIAGLIIGGVIAAPIAAYLANKIPTKSIMILVGIVVIILSLKRLFF
jgi:hypothetical protein